MPVPSSTTLHFDLDTQKSEAIDAIARATKRDTRAVIDDAIDVYLENYRRQVEHIREGLRQAEAGEFASEEEVAAFFALKA